jgi:hypothetical protein
MLAFAAKLAAAFGRTSILEPVIASVTRTAIAALIAFAAALCAAASVGCAIAALWIYLLPKFGPAGAALAAAAVLLLLGLAALAAAARIVQRKRRPQLPPDATAELAAAAARLFKEHQGPVLLAAVIAGLLAGTTKRDQ